MKFLKCKKCKHIWIYRGASEYYACCPRCHTSVKIPDCEISGEEFLRYVQEE